MDTTYQFWLKTLNKIENHAQQNDFDINGVKIWINIFWNTDGDIAHIALFPKQNSRNIDFKVLVKLLQSFIKTFPIV